ncbi:NACHT domain-containing protein [Yersinia mollaretii]|uniref:NACHT domain-containing protein n=1 Tax=Yersinia mollaretii TaxID=33060 RepID=UPI00119F1B8E|nr:hypothetical protein [Yersinia mollaretii]
MNLDIIPLNRSFSEVSKDSVGIDDDAYASSRYFSDSTTWDDLEKKYRVVILADAGAGKTIEMMSRARSIQQSGRLAFLIRIEDLVENDFSLGLEVGTSDEFEAWLASAGEAWFFLDSVDEARLAAPNAFEKAIKRFASVIKKCTHRARVYISGRPYSWRFATDRELVERYLPFSLDNATDSTKKDNALVIYSLNSLTLDDIRFYAVQRHISDAAVFVAEIERANLNAIASRPFDLDFLIATWRNDGKLGSRYELFERNVKSRLDEIDPARRQAQPLNAVKALNGASLLAGAVTFTGKSGIKIYDKSIERIGVDAEVVLADWELQNVWTLLERGVFSDAIYNMVGFRHREIRDYLSAKWLNSLLKNGHSRKAVESLIFREMYGVQVITPRLSTLVPWLILMDDQIRDKALSLQPEIALNGGDVSHLPLSVRVNILKGIIGRIANNTDEHNVRYNNAIALIAKTDLVDTISVLIDEYYTNDDVIFFLGRLLWQINQPVCLDKMMSVAADSERNIYSRIGAVRSIMTTASDAIKTSLWQKLNSESDIFSPRLLAEVIHDAAFNVQSVSFLLGSLVKLEPYRRFEPTGLVEEINTFISKASYSEIWNYEEALIELLKGIYTLIKKPPFCEQPDIGISKEYLWLLPSAIDIIERLVLIRSVACFDNSTLDLLLAFVRARDMHSDNIQEYKGALSELLPEWSELNDALFWRAVENRRNEQFFKNKRFIDDWPVQWPRHFFYFGSESFQRVLKFVTQKEFLDDKLVALSLALRIYSQSDEKEVFLTKINDAAQQHPELVQKVEWYFNPPHNPEMEAINKQQEEYKRQGKELQSQNERDRNGFIQQVKSNPEEIRNPSGVDVGEISNGQYWLYHELSKKHVDYLAKNIDWHELIETFGFDVAYAFRDAVMAHWRIYKPVSCSENDNSNTIPFKLIFGLLGLETESKERVDFPYYLSGEEIQQALLYITKEINGFPDWLDKMHLAYPDKVLAALWKEIEWEFSKSNQEKHISHIFHDVFYQAPWSHAGLAKNIYQWLEKNDLYREKDLRSCIRILINSGVNSTDLAMLAKAKVNNIEVADNLPVWFALYVDTQPKEAIPEFEKWLEKLSEDDAGIFAQRFITSLTGKLRDGGERASFTGGVRNPSSLKTLYLLMFKYINPIDDIDHSSGGVYSPTLRDDAQGARDLIFQWLAEIPGKETYIALLDLIAEYPDKNNTQWMMRAARNRAVTDADLELWADEQVKDFDASLTFTPNSPAQLYEIGVQHLLDFKDWLERGNDSLAETYQKIASETEMRNVVAHHIQNAAKGTFTCAQEAELANHQRPDIWLQHPSVNVPVPVELKLLDKFWSGPDICERLRNQLIGDYLREDEADFGIFLLIWQGKDRSQKRWVIDGEKTDISKLSNALTRYWLSISNQYPKVKDVKIIVIDLSLRAESSLD